MIFRDIDLTISWFVIREVVSYLVIQYLVIQYLATQYLVVQLSHVSNF
jgi:hypothetical protein